jgi:hypothetical protein
MARVRLFGTIFNADPIEELPNGDWRMRARSHTGRTAPGTEFVAKQSEIVEMAAAEKPADGADHADGLGTLETGMAEERKTLPTVQDLIAKARKDGTVRNPKPPDDRANR